MPTLRFNLLPCYHFIKNKAPSVQISDKLNLLKYFYISVWKWEISVGLCCSPPLISDSSWYISLFFDYHTFLLPQLYAGGVSVELAFENYASEPVSRQTTSYKLRSLNQLRFSRHL